MNGFLIMFILSVFLTEREINQISAISAFSYVIKCILDPRSYREILRDKIVKNRLRKIIKDDSKIHNKYRILLFIRNRKAILIGQACDVKNVLYIENLVKNSLNNKYKVINCLTCKNPINLFKKIYDAIYIIKINAENILRNATIFNLINYKIIVDDNRVFVISLYHHHDIEQIKKIVRVPRNKIKIINY